MCPRQLLTHAFALRRDFHVLVPARGWTKQLWRVQAVPLCAGARRLPARLLTPSKLSRSPRRPFKTTGSRSWERAQFVTGSTRGQSRDRVSCGRSRSQGRAAPGAHPKQRGRERGRPDALRDRSPQRRVSCSIFGCARPWLPPFGLQLPGTVGAARHGSGIRGSPRVRFAARAAGSHGTARPRR